MSPKPDYERAPNLPNGIPKLYIRDRTKHSPAVASNIPGSPTTTLLASPVEPKRDEESLRSYDEITITPPSPTASANSITVLPWEKNDFKTKSVHDLGEDYVACTNERRSSKSSKQPFRQEVPRHCKLLSFFPQIDSMIVSFLTSRGTKELNLPSQLRTRAIRAARESTHPDVFEPVNEHIWDLLLNCSHPNFIRYITCNAHPPRIWCAYVAGSLMISLSLLEALLCIVYGLGQAWRVFSLPLFLIGSTAFVAARYGMCVVLYGLQHRQLQPWELFRQGETGAFALEMERKFRIFDKEIWIEEPVLRQIQNKIFCQALAIGLLLTIVMETVFLSVPNVRR